MQLKLNNGNEMPMFGLGTWNSPKGEVKQAVEWAIDAGYRHIDCAHCYENEAEVGEAISNKIKQGIVKREDLWITSKLWNTNHLPENVETGLNTTLKNLGLDYLDLYLIHWPTAFKYAGEDERMPGGFDIKTLEIDDSADYVETWKCLEKIYRESKKLKNIGVSNFNTFQLNRILNETETVPQINQIEIHGYFPQNELVEFCKSKDIQLTAYSPLSSPGFCMDFLKKNSHPVLIQEPKVVKIGEEHGKSAAQVLLRWILQRGIVVIPKSVTKSRIEQNFGIFDFELNEGQMSVINDLGVSLQICVPEPFKASKFYPFVEKYSE